MTERTPPASQQVPNPYFEDPTRLTTELVDRAINAFQQVMDGRRDVIDTRLSAMDKATQLVAENLAKLIAATERDHDTIWVRHENHMRHEREFIMSQVENVRAVADERFSGIRTQFAERDTRTEQAAEESRISLDAALAAAKEAVSEQNKANALAIGKSEDATKERLDSLATLMTNSTGSLAAQISDLKDRVISIEAAGGARTDVRTEGRLNVGQVLVGIGLVIAAASVIVSVLIAKG